MSGSLVQNGQAVQIPMDLHVYEIMRFLPLRAILTISSTCFELLSRYSEVAQNELRRMHFPLGLNPILVRNVAIINLPLRNLSSLASHWQGLTPDECRIIRESLVSNPLNYYTEFDPVRVLLEEEALAARDDEDGLVSLVKKEKDASRALVLANQITNDESREAILSGLILKRPWQTALKIVQTLAIERNRTDNKDTHKRTSVFPRNYTLCTLVNREELPLEAAEEIIQLISDTRIQDAALSTLADRLPWKNALLIIKKISNKLSRDFALRYLAPREELPLEEGLEIIKTILDERTQSAALNDLALRENLSLETVLEIIKKISDKMIRSIALKNVAKNLPCETALEIIQIIPEERERNFSLSDLAKREGLSLIIALGIIKKISDGWMRDLTRDSLSRRKDLPLETALEIIKEISDEAIRGTALRFQAQKHPIETAQTIIQKILDKGNRNNALLDLALREGLSLKTALAIIETISDLDTQSWALSDLIKKLPLKIALKVIPMISIQPQRDLALGELALRKELSLKAALEIIRTISDRHHRAFFLQERINKEEKPTDEQEPIGEPPLKKRRLNED